MIGKNTQCHEFCTLLQFHLAGITMEDTIVFSYQEKLTGVKTQYDAIDKIRMSQLIIFLAHPRSYSRIRMFWS